MYRHALHVQNTDNLGTIYDGLLRLAATADYDKLTVAVAYATRRGCKRITDGFSSKLSKWKKVEKRWLVSFDLGITEPAALEFLASLPNSQVRIAGAEMALKTRLRPSIHFHSKFYLLECRDDPDSIAVFSTSANLTDNGLYFNSEQATASVWSPPLEKREKLQVIGLQRQKKVIDHMFAGATPLDDGLLAKYKKLWRPNKVDEVESKIAGVVIQPNPVVDLPEAVALATARSFWVRVTDRVVPNLGEDRPGNQIDLQRGSRAFFGIGVEQVPTNTPLGPVRIRFGGEVSLRSMRFGNNSMDKINLPVLEAPRTYAGQTLLFERCDDGVFDLHIGVAKQASRWRRLSETQGTLYVMKSGREYGVFT